jgi:NADH dehydrogenase [ubiquinone] 1 alpha subcomplex assembly factor 1
MKLLFLLILFPILMNESLLFDFTNKTNLREWRIIDDGVMGGVSNGKFKIDENGNGVFFGYVSTENNGGFSSVRHQMRTKDLSGFTKVCIRLKGDGKEYQFRIKDDINSYYSYITTFKTSGEWETITIHLKDLYPSFRGQTLKLPNFKGNVLEEMVFLIGNKKNESFELKLDKIELVK